MSVRAVYGLPAVVVAVTVVVDQLTKWWALERLDAGRVIDLIWTLRLRLTFNTGFAFSAGEGFGWLIGLAAIAISIVLVVWMRQLPTAGSRAAAGLVLGGAIGNVIDRVARADDGFMSGGVVDFIDLQWWPVFNIADSAICIGVVWLLIVVGRTPMVSPSAAPTVDEPSGLDADSGSLDDQASAPSDAASDVSDPT